MLNPFLYCSSPSSLITLESSMEEVWKDITTLSSSHRSYLPAAVVAHHQSSLHEFLASPMYPSTESCDLRIPSWAGSQKKKINNKACSKKLTDQSSRPSQQIYGSFLCGHSSLMLSSVLETSPFPPQKKDSEDDNGCCDRRYKRKMKNRESATRSRARKQAYTNELELELAHLREENAMLRRRQEEICSTAGTVAQVAKKSTLLRSLTAPF